MKRKKLIRNLCLLIITLALILFLSDTPRFLPMLYFRAVERGNLVGPSEILAVEEIHYRDYNTMTVAETEEGVILWIEGSYTSHFCYRQRYSDPLLLANPSPTVMLSALDEGPVPLVLFDSQPKAARVELVFTLDVNLNGRDFQKDYSLSADRKNNGYFLFYLDVCPLTGDWESEAERSAVRQFCLHSAGENQDPSYGVPILVRFYDRAGELLEETTIQVRSVDEPLS